MEKATSYLFLQFSGILESIPGQHDYIRLYIRERMFPGCFHLNHVIDGGKVSMLMHVQSVISRS